MMKLTPGVVFLNYFAPTKVIIMKPTHFVVNECRYNMSKQAG